MREFFYQGYPAILRWLRMATVFWSVNAINFLCKFLCNFLVKYLKSLQTAKKKDFLYQFHATWWIADNYSIIIRGLVERIYRTINFCNYKLDGFLSQFVQFLSLLEHQAVSFPSISKCYLLIKIKIGRSGACKLRIMEIKRNKKSNFGFQFV